MVAAPHRTPMAIHGSLYCAHWMGVGAAKPHTTLDDYLFPSMACRYRHRTAALAHRQMVQLRHRLYALLH